ncbi:unnamed protein product [Sphacelaria rigidula]
MSRRSVQVEIFAAGDGINYPQKGQTVTVHYTGYLEDGTQFDSSRYRGKPFKFKLGNEQVVPGLDEGVSQLSIGERAKVTIPAASAYGARGFPGLVPPNSALVFDLELITFN